MQRRPTLNWVCHFYTSLYGEIHSSKENYALNKRIALQFAIVYFEYTVYTARKEKIIRKLTPERNFIRVYCQGGLVQV